MNYRLCSGSIPLFRFCFFKRSLPESTEMDRRNRDSELRDTAVDGANQIPASTMGSSDVHRVIVPLPVPPHS